MKYFIIAGEKSGDLHASNLIRFLKQNDKNADIQAFGGNLMQESGAKLLLHYSKINFMGFWEVFKNIFTIKKRITECQNAILDFKPDALILIDFAGFNLRIAKFAKQHQIKIYYYISPKIWAWNEKRVHSIKKLVDKMFVIMPFEKDFYKKYDYEVEYVGNPLFDEISRFQKSTDFRQKNQLSEKPIIAILAGSRKQEVSKLLPVMLSVSKQFSDYQFVVAGVDELEKDLYELAFAQNIKVVFNQTYDLLANATAAIVTSGTATLETALFKIPQVVVYKTSPITYWIVKMLIKIRFISLVNLIADKEIVKELIQHECNTEKLAIELNLILHQNRKNVLNDYDALYELVKTPFSASETTAKWISKDLGTI